MRPFLRNLSATSARRSLKMTIRCHSVFSRRSPEALSVQLSLVARVMLTILPPLWVFRTSGSLPRLPTSVTLFTEPAIFRLHHFIFARMASAVAVASLGCGRPEPVMEREATSEGGSGAEAACSFTVPSEPQARRLGGAGVASNGDRFRPHNPRDATATAAALHLSHLGPSSFNLAFPDPAILLATIPGRCCSYVVSQTMDAGRIASC